MFAFVFTAPIGVAKLSTYVCMCMHRERHGLFVIRILTCLDVGSRNLSVWSKVNPDELAL